ncbi:hypothetical protein D3C78_1685460 [compost metagenome]
MCKWLRKGCILTALQPGHEAQRQHAAIMQTLQWCSREVLFEETEAVEFVINHIVRRLPVRRLEITAIGMDAFELQPEGIAAPAQ